jgi:hypothetical protein
MPIRRNFKKYGEGFARGNFYTPCYFSQIGGVKGEED